MAEIDDRMRGILTLLDHAPLEGHRTILDVGIGNGQISGWLINRHKRVIGTGISLASYDIPPTIRPHVRITECWADALPFANGSFDAVVMSHVLEHCPNVGNALQEARRVLADDGLLMVFVPPQEDVVLAGHISMGWNMGQLMYVLITNGFDVKNGSFIYFSWSVCAFVRKELRPLPKLRGDRGDIRTLAEDGRFPLPIVTRDGRNDGFRGVLGAVNWKGMIPHERSWKANLVSWLVPTPGLKIRAGALLMRVGSVLARTGSINPTELRF